MVVAAGLSADARMTLAQVAAEADFARVTMDGEAAYMARQPQVRLGPAVVSLPAGGFLQATAQAEAAMAAFVAEAAAGGISMAGFYERRARRIVPALVFVLWGSYESVATVFDTADAAMGLMATINLVAIYLMSGLVTKLTRDYFAQRRKGVPRFNPADYPELGDQIDRDIWTQRR